MKLLNFENWSSGELSKIGHQYCHTANGIAPQFFSDDFPLKVISHLIGQRPGDSFFYRFDLFLHSLHSKQPTLQIYWSYILRYSIVSHLSS
jgi:hypothetical protein